jgi:hypothetical protein
VASTSGFGNRGLRRVTALAAAAAAAALLAVGASADTITTFPTWDGTTALSSYGLGLSTPTYGQTVTGTGENLRSFTFSINANGGTVTARGGVGVWDGTKATSVLWLDPTFQTVTGSTFTTVTFTTPNVTLQSGQSYVLFASAYGDGGGGGATWAENQNADSYTGGARVYTNENSSSYATDAWDGVSGSQDFAFSMDLEPASEPQPSRGGYCSVAGNTRPDGTPIPPGTFLNLDGGQPATDPRVAGATPAFYYEGLGISCSGLPGYTATGEHVGYFGHGDPGPYPYYAKNG